MTKTKISYPSSSEVEGHKVSTLEILYNHTMVPSSTRHQMWPTAEVPSIKITSGMKSPSNQGQLDVSKCLL
jgi:hypothetical protein